MPYRLDPGTRGAVFLVCFVLFQVLLLVIRRKWRLAEARRAEVIRLMRFAEAEVERAEREAAAFASAEPPATLLGGGEMGMSICAVCQRPTTNRCARCKIVKYCSGKCQIIHWRRGHKDKCHPAPVECSKGELHVPDLKREQAERSEITDYEPEIKFHSHLNDDQHSAYQSISIMDGEQAEEVIMGNETSVSEGKLDGIEFFVTSSNNLLSSKSNHSSEIYSEIGNIKQKRSSNHFEKGFTAAMTVSPTFTVPSARCPVEMTDNSSLTEDYTEAETEKHCNTNHSDVSFDHQGNVGGFFKSNRTSTLDLEQVKLLSVSPETATANPFGFSLNSLKVQPTRVNEEAGCKLNAPSIGSYNTYLGIGPCQKDIESRPAGSNLKISNKPKSSKFYECDDAYNATLVRIVKSDDYIESRNSCNNDNQLASKPFSAGTAKLSTPTSFYPVSIPDKLEPTDTKNKFFRKPCGDKSKEHFKSLSPSLGSLSPLVDYPNSSKNASFIVENDPPISTRLLKISGSLLNGKAFVTRDFKKFSSSMSPQLVQPGICSYGSLKYDYKMLFPYELFIKLYNSDKMGHIPCGLINCGNSCYANAVLQCLAFTRPLAAYLLEGFHAKTCAKKEWCFTCAFGSLLVNANQGKSPLSPIEIISHMHDICSNFSQGTQEDAHEFLRHAIDTMQSACLKEAGANTVGELAQETTLIQLMFGGYLHSKIKCMRCKGKSECRERMMDLTVEMYGDIETLEEALGRFTATEVLEGENKYKCDRCKSYEDAKKHLTILEAPNVLTIALKRYQSGKFGKLNKMVRFPEYLNLAPYMKDSDDKSPVYRLYAAVVHNDVMNATFSGHYICFVKNTLGKWFKVDDAVVKQVELQTVLSQGAYMLLYSRCSPRAPSLLRKELAKKSGLKQSGDSQMQRSNPMFSQFGLLNSHRSDNLPSHADIPSNLRHRDLFNERVCRSKLDVSSDSSSLFSYSDEASSWSAGSTKDSASGEDFTEW